MKLKRISLPGNFPTPSRDSSESSCEPGCFEYSDALMSIPIRRIAGMEIPMNSQCFRSDEGINNRRLVTFQDSLHVEKKCLLLDCRGLSRAMRAKVQLRQVCGKNSRTHN